MTNIEIKDANHKNVTKLKVEKLVSLVNSELNKMLNTALKGNHHEKIEYDLKLLNKMIPVIKRSLDKEGPHIGLKTNHGKKIKKLFDQLIDTAGKTNFTSEESNIVMKELKGNISEVDHINNVVANAKNIHDGEFKL